MIAKMALGLTLLIGTLAQGQNAPKIEEESWSDKPVLQQIDKAYATTSAIILLDTRKIEFVDDAKGNVLCYKTLHKLLHINDDQGIEAFNKVYLPVADNADIVAIKARTILPDGKVIELDKSNIKDLKEGERLYKIFAVDGLQKGCEVEYYYTYNANVNYFGNEVMQTVLPVVKSSFTIISPVRLSFEMKVYNNSARATDTILADKRWVQTNLPV
ncbi:MAG TPA: DUF3857 domain-containing protein, partial [Chitinophagaceae bacterium]|nr:DUF3857 domain-containing protein [Chitinophagaceae bacterium]